MTSDEDIYSWIEANPFTVSDYYYSGDVPSGFKGARYYRAEEYLIQKCIEYFGYESYEEELWEEEGQI